MQHYTFSLSARPPPVAPSSMLGAYLFGNFDEDPNIELGGGGGGGGAMKQRMKNHSVAIICPPTVSYYFEAAGEVFGRAD